MRSLAVVATDETGPAHSFPLYVVYQGQNRVKSQWKEWNTIATGVCEASAGQGEDVEGQVGLDDESELFYA